MRNNLTMFLFSVLVVTLVSACGGGSGSSTPTSSVRVSGAVIKGPVAGAMVKAYGVTTSGAKGAQIGETMTDHQGNFSFTLGDHTGPVLLEMTGGSYLDEATGFTMNMGQSDVLTCVVPALTQEDTSEIQLTPLTSMAQAMAENMPGGMTAANITGANNAVGQYFQIEDIVHTHPIDPLSTGSSLGATHDMIYYGMTVAAMSEYAHMTGLDESSNVVTAFMHDSADGYMDGTMDGSQITMGHHGGMMSGGTMMQHDAGTVGLAEAMEQFIISPFNMSGITLQDMQDLIDMLNTSNGVIQ